VLTLKKPRHWVLTLSSVVIVGVVGYFGILIHQIGWQVHQVEELCKEMRPGTPVAKIHPAIEKHGLWNGLVAYQFDHEGGRGYYREQTKTWDYGVPAPMTLGGTEGPSASLAMTARSLFIQKSCTSSIWRSQNEMLMIMRRSPLIVAVLLSLGGCDGHLVTLNIREQQTAHERAHRRTLYVCGGPDVPELVRVVADSLNLIEETASPEAMSKSEYTGRSPDGRFRLFLENINGGVWRVELADWPNSSQSALSKHVEAEIRQRVTASCSSS